MDIHENNFALQKHQQFVVKFMNPNIHISDVLFLFHGTGSGKTCSAVLASEQYSDYLKSHPDINGYIYVIGTHTTHEEFIKNITTECGNIANLKPFYSKNKYNVDDFAENEEIKIRYINKKLKVNFYKFVTFQKFAYDSVFEEINNFNNCLIIIDEAHSLLNNNKFNTGFQYIIEKSDNYKLLLMSATPMINDPENIINFINIMYKKKYHINKSDVFASKGVLYPDGLDKIANKFRGKLSYLSSHDPKWFPQRIEVGVIPKGLLKYTKIIPVPMSIHQYSAYKKVYNGKMTHEIKNIIDFVLPSPIKNEYIYTNLVNDAKQFPLKWLNKLQIIVTRDKLSGNFLHVDNLHKWSGKYHKCMNDIITTPIGSTLIFSRFVHNSGIQLFAEIMKINGFDEWRSEKSILTHSPNSRHFATHIPYSQIPVSERDGFVSAKYVVIYDKISVQQRRKIINTFNSVENRTGKLIKYILGSNLIKESVDLKRIMHVRILAYQDNFSRVEQIIGRAMRFGSHKDVTPTTHIYRYVSALRTDSLQSNPLSSSDLGSKFSAEEIEYNKDEKNHVIIKKIERRLKIISLDCNVNKKHYKKSDNNTMICDYMKCDYKCENGQDYDFETIYGFKDSFIYDLFYSKIDRYNIITYIIHMFYNNQIIDIMSIVNRLKYEFKEYHIYIAIEYLINSRKQFTFKNKYGIYGYLITDGTNIMFMPSLYEPSKTIVSLNMRGINSTMFHLLNDVVNVTSDFEDILHHEKMKTKTIISPSIIISTIKKLTNSYPQYVEYISSLSKKNKIYLLEWALIKWKNKNINNNIFNTLKYFKDYLIDQDVLVRSNYQMYNENYDNYFDILLSSSPRRNFIGHIYNLSVSVNTNDNKFKIQGNILTYVNYPDNNIIVGYNHINMNNDELYLKLKYTYFTSTHDKRKLKKGFKCNQINSKREINEIYEKLRKALLKDDYRADSNVYKISRYCKLVGTLLKKLQLRNGSIPEDKRLRWYYDVMF